MRRRLASLVAATTLLPLPLLALSPLANAVPTAIEVTPLVVDFGDVAVGETSPPVAAQVTNTGASSFGPIDIFGGAPPTPRVQHQPPATLAPGASCQVEYTFSPTAEGKFSDQSGFTISQTGTQSGGEDFLVALFGLQRFTVVVPRSVRLKLRGHLNAKGRVRADGDPAACISGVTVAIQRKKHRHWRTVDTTLTDEFGKYKESVTQRRGKYRAVVSTLRIAADHLVCEGAVSRAKRPPRA